PGGIRFSSVGHTPAMSLGNRLLLLASVLSLLMSGTTAAAQAARATASEVTIDAQPAFADEESTLRMALTDADGGPLAGAALTVERRTGDTWEPVSVVTTDETGRAS